MHRLYVFTNNYTLRVTAAWKMIRRGLFLLLGLFALRESSLAENAESKPFSQKSHHRQKRVFWFTNDGRIALPPGTVMTITPTLALPFVRHPPYGFLSNITISLPFTSEFINQKFLCNISRRDHENVHFRNLIFFGTMREREEE